jgi:hypothetical protein
MVRAISASGTSDGNRQGSPESNLDALRAARNCAPLAFNLAKSAARMSSIAFLI